MSPKDSEIKPRYSINVTGGVRPSGPISVVYPSTPDELRTLLQMIVPIPRELWRKYGERAEWLVTVGALCANPHPEMALNWQPFITRTQPERVAVVIQVYPPVVIIETAFDAVSEEAPQVQRPILGPNGERVR